MFQVVALQASGVSPGSKAQSKGVIINEHCRIFEYLAGYLSEDVAVEIFGFQCLSLHRPTFLVTLWRERTLVLRNVMSVGSWRSATRRRGTE